MTETFLDDVLKHTDTHVLLRNKTYRPSAVIVTTRRLVAQYCIGSHTIVTRGYRNRHAHGTQIQSFGVESVHHIGVIGLLFERKCVREKIRQQMK